MLVLGVEEFKNLPGREASMNQNAAAWQGRLGENLYWGVWTLGPWDLHPLALLFALSGTLMISKTLRIPKL